MNILDLIKKTSALLSIEEILNDTNISISSETDEETSLKNNKTLQKLFEFSKIVLNEVYSYVQKTFTKTCTSNNGTIKYSAVGSNVSKIISVKDINGTRVGYEISGNNILLKQDATYIVEYNMYPNVNSIGNPIDMYNGDISEDLLINGLNAYYCLAMGLYNEFNIYNKNYSDGLNRIKKLGLFALPCRRWNE